MSEYFDHFKIVITDGDRQWVKKVSSHDFFFGRMAPCELLLEASFISRRHGHIFVEDGNLWIEDMKSSNGIFVNGLKIRPGEKTPLPTQAVITFGENHKLSLIVDVVLAREDEDVRITGTGNPNDLKEQASLALNKINNVMSNSLQLIRMKIENKEKLIEHVKNESKEIIKATREERDTLLEQAKAEAKKVVADAQAIADKTLKEAEAQSVALLKEVEVQVAEQRKDAAKELKKHQENLESHNASLERLKKEIEDYTAQSAKAREELVNVQQQVIEKNQLEKDLASLKQNTTLEKDLLARVEAEVKLVEQRRKELHEENIKLSVVPQQIQKEVESLQKDHERAEAQLAKAHEEKTHIQKFIDELIGQRKDLKNQIDEEKQQAKIEREAFQKELEDHKKKLLAETQEKCDQLTSETHARIEKLTEESRLAATQTMSSAREQAEKILGDARTSAQDAEARSEKIMKDAREFVFNLEKESKQKADELVSSAEERSAQMLNAARTQSAEESNRVIQAAQKQADSLTEVARAEAESKIQAAEAQVIQLQARIGSLTSEISDLEAKLSTREKEVESGLADRREKALRALDAELLEKKARGLQANEVELKNAEARYKEYMKGEALAVQNRLIETAATKMKGLLRPDLSGDDKARLDHVLKKATEAVLLGVDFDEKELEAHLKARPVAQQKKNKRFFAMALSGTAVIAVLAFAFPTIMKQFEESAREVASAAKEKDLETIKKMEEEREILERFEPELVDEYKGSYTDRVLYTRGYVARELDPAFREKWILELNDHLLRELKMNEDVVVAFIAKEANLIRELQSTKENINGQYAEEGIARMREIEKIFVDNVQKLAGSKKNLNKILEYKKSFYLR